MSIFEPNRSVVSSIEVGLQGLMSRYTATSANVVNAETPGYQVQKVDFENNLQQAQLKAHGLEDDIGLLQTNGKHISLTNPDISQTPIDLSIEHSNEIVNDNNVDIEREMMTMAKTGLKYRGLATVGSKYFELMSGIIRG